MFREMRRTDRRIDNGRIVEILMNGHYGVFSTIGENGFPYGVPLSYVYLNSHIYFHCATNGYKLDNLKNNDKVSFCVIGNTEILPQDFSTKYESVIAFGKALEVFEDEKIKVLRELLKKYSKDYLEKGEAYIKNAGDKTKVIKIEIQNITGKARK
ncbi:pyridoxamine 5'-phosphate oxidase family protein [Alkaliphilus peptidifermentans]|uniref:Nitroimidazol reductase NimA, pyridoxamine 5'-phosphate oxidase superfamily n=1 Tax=Alkaliphilus peptidifermentans DSM 18978 TaxID=1120976 RepID=A0A1G5DKH5_9FIRM|nr:pyridoxamine 5'-phosphate oxidase family protein [Alkaliphilus peptidifermentans]SCY15067.1 hypothetical protein SAMN03080606_00935 [Alkaliphilus peptidifermentans DSM 18978]